MALPQLSDEQRKEALAKAAEARKALKPSDDPNVTFSLGDDKAVAVYAYCNLHGLWKTEI